MAVDSSIAPCHTVRTHEELYIRFLTADPNIYKCLIASKSFKWAAPIVQERVKSDRRKVKPNCFNNRNAVCGKVIKEPIRGVTSFLQIERREANLLTGDICICMLCISACICKFRVVFIYLLFVTFLLIAVFY